MAEKFVVYEKLRARVKSIIEFFIGLKIITRKYVRRAVCHSTRFRKTFSQTCTMMMDVYNEKPYKSASPGT
jgi:hypothetical protein